MSGIEGKILYCSRMCTETMFKRLFENTDNKPAQQVQKYHRTLYKGFCAIDNVNVKAYSVLPINSNNYRKLIFLKKNDSEDDSIEYVSILNLPVLRNLSQIIAGAQVVKNNAKTQDVCIIDILNISFNMGIVSECKKKHVFVIGIVTDLPDILFADINGSIKKKANEIIEACDAYVFLTQAMNDRLNKAGKPYIVIEGQSDELMQERDNNLVGKDEPAVIMYSGSIHKIHGVDNLVKGFLKAKIEDVELHIYGEGDYAEELKCICKNNSNIKYYGVRLINEVVDAQIRATLLVNPRPTNQEFVKYSFPSKTMEYMASGTPLLTTNLPGMPQEYKNYVYLIENESAIGICNSLKQLFEKSKMELHNKGKKAKSFVITNKNGRVQAMKIVDLIDNMRRQSV